MTPFMCTCVSCNTPCPSFCHYLLQNLASDKKLVHSVLNKSDTKYGKRFPLHLNSHQETKNSSGDDIVNVNFIYDHIVHALQNTTDWCINFATHDAVSLCVRTQFTKFIEITQCNGHYAILGHSRSPILVPIESLYTTSY